ncbi:putative cyclin-dependent kinase F-2 [Setaria viridis]|uniref:putative cyclin-dependent kinase F-2 n=1 Tax=Setaria viridis TaxID=4556 RepID=UPI0014937B18|nr:putative cyclin-dependent kinase F-2 [Setaria viridis]
MASSARWSLGTAAAVDAPWPPEIEERYERLQKLGEGIFGRVYKARDRANNRIVAVKQLSGRSDGTFVQTGFLELAREVTSLHRCRSHPSIVRFRNVHAEKRAAVGDGSDDDGDSFIVMEYAGRMNLRVYMVSRGIHGMPFSEAEVRGIMRQLLAAVEASHHAGILHRDIKPENVVVDDATPMAAGGGRECSPLATSDAYRAPELFLRSADYDGRVDTWGIGCIMAELLAGTGAAFFEGKTAEDVFANMLGVVGARGIKDWLGPRQPGSGRRSAAEERARRCPETGRLRKVFPEKVLSQAGFEVLSGLLESSPKIRLTAAEALQKPWFNDQRTDDEGPRESPRRRGLLGVCFMSCATDD